MSTSSGGNRPWLLDTFCGAGGATRGYQRAGFNVLGVDISPRPHYCGDVFIQEDALVILGLLAAGGSFCPHDEPTREFFLEDFAGIHASPPCQFATAYKRTGNVKPSPNLIPETRKLLQATELPYIIENVYGALSWMRQPILICGSMFDPPLPIERHRFFETNWMLPQPTWPCRHKLNGKDNYPGGRSVARTGHSRGLVRATMEIGSWDIPLADQQEAMGIDWMTLEELSEAIPPAYTEFIGEQLLDSLPNHDEIMREAVRGF